MDSYPVFLSPSTPSSLLTEILNHELYPTTVLIGCSKRDFQDALAEDVAEPPPNPLYQVAVARHIRMLFVPTVMHLRSFLSVFDPASSKTPPPPAPYYDKEERNRNKKPVLLLYGFLDLHRDSSEWNGQGIMQSAAVTVEAAQRVGFRAVLIEPAGEDGHPTFEALLSQTIPILGPDINNPSSLWKSRMVDVRTPLGRWFKFEERGLGGRPDTK